MRKVTEDLLEKYEDKNGTYITNNKFEAEKINLEKEINSIAIGTTMLKMNQKYKKDQLIVVDHCIFLGCSDLSNCIEIDSNKIIFSGVTIASHEIGTKLLRLLTMWENFVTAPKRFFGWVKSKFTRKSKVVISK